MISPGLRDPETPPKRQDQGGGGGEGPRVEQKRQRGGDGEERAPDGAARELVRDQLRGEEAPVRLLQLLLRDDGGHDRQGGVGEEGLGGSQKKVHGVQQRQRGPVGQHGEPQNTQERTPEQVHGPHRQPAVHPVHEGAAREREEQPGELLGDDETSDEDGIPGQRRREKGAGDERDPITQVGDRARRPQLPVLGAEGTTGHSLPSRSPGH